MFTILIGLICAGIAFKLVPGTNPAKKKAISAVKAGLRWVSAAILAVVALILVISGIGQLIGPPRPSFKLAPIKMPTTSSPVTRTTREPAPSVPADQPDSSATQTAILPDPRPGWELAHNSPTRGTEWFPAKVAGDGQTLTITQISWEDGERVRTRYCGQLTEVGTFAGEWVELRSNPAHGHFWLRFENGQEAEGVKFYSDDRGRQQQMPLAITRAE